MIARSALLVAALLLAACTQARDDDTLVARGRGVFQDQGCYGYTVGAMGTPIAPDLSRIGAKRDAAYLTRWLRDPLLSASLSWILGICAVGRWKCRRWRLISARCGEAACGTRDEARGRRGLAPHASACRSCTDCTVDQCADVTAR